MQTLSNFASFQSLMAPASIQLEQVRFSIPPIKKIADSFRQTKSRQTIVRQLVSKPSLLYEKIQDVQEFEREVQHSFTRTTPTSIAQTDESTVEQTIVSPGARHITAIRCRCKSAQFQQQTSWTILGIPIKTAVVNPHRRKCPRYRDFENYSKNSFDIQCTRALLETAVSISQSSRAGAGGYAINCKLVLKGRYMPNSPLQDLLEHLPRPLEWDIDLQSCSLRLEQTLLQIRKSLQSGESSIHEIDRFGSSMTTVSLKCCVMEFPLK